MKKNIFLVIVIASVFLFTSGSSVSADVGPKPALQVTITGVTEEYYFDVLVYVSHDLENYDTEPWNYYQDEYPEILLEYQDDEGFVSYAVYDIPSGMSFSGTTESGDVYNMNYIAPREFKLVLVMKDNNAIIVSDYMETTRFESAVVWDLTNTNLTENVTSAGMLSGNIQGDSLASPNWLITGFNTIIRVILTVAIELGVLWLFGFRKKSSFIKVGVVNAITQTILSVLLISMYLQGGMWTYLFLALFGEFFVFATEIIIYFKIIDEHTKGRLFLYTIVANFLTIIAGLFLVSLV